jgi:branched-chain amino acid transport system permease protein
LSVTVSRFVFEQPSVTTGIRVGPPGTFASDNNFYILELICLGVAFWLVHNLHHGRLGRALIAIRDDTAGALASGIDVRRVKLLVFGASSALAALGGALLAMGDQAFDPSAFDPIRGLIWFAAVVVFGVDSAPGAVIGAGMLVALDAAFQNGTSTIVVGIAALALGRLPGGLLHSVRVLVERMLGRSIAVLGVGGPGRNGARGRPDGHRLTPRGQLVAESIRRRVHA